jgi:hypothetical protein
VIFLFFKASRPTVVPTQHPMQCVPTFFLGGKAAGVKLHSPPTSTELKNAWCCTSSPPICLHGVVRDSLVLTLG